jgi:hypothetical protein
VIQAIVTCEDDVDRSISLETVGMLQATGIQAYDVEIEQIRAYERTSRATDSATAPPRIFICCVHTRASTVDGLRASVGFSLAVSATSDGASSLTVRHSGDGGTTSANRSAEYVAEVAVHILESPPPCPIVLHLDLQTAPGFRRIRLAYVSESSRAFALPVRTHHLTLTPVALDAKQSAAANAWASKLLEKLQPCESTGLGCTCCNQTPFFTQLICNERNAENDENRLGTY